MNTLTVVGFESIGTPIYLSSEKANIQLVQEVLNIVYGADLVYFIFEGNIECINNNNKKTLLDEIKKRLSWLEKSTFVKVYAYDKLNKLKEYVSIVESNLT